MKANQNKRVSKLRFPGFEGEWAMLALGENIELISGQHLSPEEYNKSGEGVPYFTGPSDFADEIGQVTKWAEKATHFGLENDVLITVKGNGVGTMSLQRLEKVALGRQLMAIRSHIVSTIFVYQYLLTQQNLFDKLAAGNLIPGLSRHDILKIRFLFPTLPEQEKIAAFLSAVDTKLQALRQKKTLLAQYKKGLMQQLFSVVLRFKDANGKDFPDWEEKRLGDILLDFRLGGNYPNTEQVTAFPLIKMGNLGRGQMNLRKLEYIPLDSPIDCKDKIEFGDLFLNTRNTLDLVGKVAIWRNELPIAYYNSNLMYLRFENNFFMNYCLNSFEGLMKLRRLATGTTSVAAIYARDLLHIKLSIPSLPEQQKIATFLTAIDKKIETVSAEITAVEEWKKGLLQQLFV